MIFFVLQHRGVKSGYKCDVTHQLPLRLRLHWLTSIVCVDVSEDAESGALPEEEADLVSPEKKYEGTLSRHPRAATTEKVAHATIHNVLSECSVKQ